MLFAAFLALGVWQLQRLAWKTELIAQVDARIHAAAAPAPGPAAWPAVNRRADAYRRVVARGTFLHDRETRVQAVTALGGGFWVLTPLRTDQGFVVLINRGFVPPDSRDPVTRPAPQGEVRVEGLLRISEPGGGFLRANDPEADRWYSRDVAAIAAARSLGQVAPYFIDADAAPGVMWPRGGLTVVRFSNSHLVYALTWFAMAALTAAGFVLLWRERRRRLR